MCRAARAQHPAEPPPSRICTVVPARSNSRQPAARRSVHTVQSVPAYSLGATAAASASACSSRAAASGAAKPAMLASKAVPHVAVRMGSSQPPWPCGQAEGSTALGHNHRHGTPSLDCACAHACRVAGSGCSEADAACGQALLESPAKSCWHVPTWPGVQSLAIAGSCLVQDGPEHQQVAYRCQQQADVERARHRAAKEIILCLVLRGETQRRVEAEPWLARWGRHAEQSARRVRQGRSDIGGECSARAAPCRAGARRHLCWRPGPTLRVYVMAGRMVIRAPPTPFHVM